MRFRYINIPKLVLQLLRGNYSVRHDYDAQTQPQITTNLYRYCLACVSNFQQYLQSYYENRSKYYMYAVCTPVYGQIERVLNYWYGTFGNITITPSSAETGVSYWYAEDTPKKYLFEGDTPPVYLGFGGNYTEKPIVNVPKALADLPEVYSQFIADVNLLLPFYITYSVNIIS